MQAPARSDDNPTAPSMSASSAAVARRPMTTVPAMTAGNSRLHRGGVGGKRHCSGMRHCPVDGRRVFVLGGRVTGGNRAVTDRCSGAGARPSGSLGAPAGAATAGKGAGDGAITERAG